MTTKHTPGPWETADAYGPTADGTCVKAVGDDYLIASCTGYYGRDGGLANAHLIAAAPELLEALSHAYELLLCGLEPATRIKSQRTLCEVRDALAKATSTDPQTVQDDHEHYALIAKGISA